MSLNVSRPLCVVSLMAVAALVGCAGRPSLLPNPDKELRKTSVQFAADAAKRQYPADGPRGGDAQAHASVDHGLGNKIEAVNLSDEAWNNVEVWVNQTYVVVVPNWPSKQLKVLHFQMLFDREGGSFPVDNKNIRVEKLEIVRDGKVYAVPTKLAD